MGYQPRTRNRVHAIRRGPDGSAFDRCEQCGVLVAIALVDMHECQVMKNVNNVKKSMGSQCGHESGGEGQEPKSQGQPRSAYCFFLEEFRKTCPEESEVDVDRRAIEIWKNMSDSDKESYVLEAEKLNSAYVKALLQEEKNMIWVDDEADSAEVGKFVEDFEGCDQYDDSEESGGWWSETSESLDIFMRTAIDPWMSQSSG